MVHSVLYHNGDTREVLSDEWAALIKVQNYSAVIFDCDGTLVHSSTAHFKAFGAAVTNQGYVLDRDWYFDRTGLGRVQLLGAFAAEIAPDIDVERAIEESISAFWDVSHEAKAISPTADLARGLLGKLPISVGTNAELTVTQASLTATGQIDVFDIIVSVSDNLPPKPAPDIFLCAAKRMGVQPDQVLVFEDSSQGVKAAQVAGMDVIKILA